MDDSIFAGRLSLTDADVPEPAPATAWDSPAASPVSDVRQAMGRMNPGDVTESRNPQFQPVPEPMLSPAAMRVREEARKLGIDYDAEVAKILTRMGGYGLHGELPNPLNKRAGPDPYKNVSPADRRMAEYAATEILRRKFEKSAQLPKLVQDLWSKEVMYQAMPTLRFEDYAVRKG